MLSVDMSPVQWTDRPFQTSSAGRMDPIWEQEAAGSNPVTPTMIRRLVLGQAKQLSTAGGAVALHPAPGSSSDSSAQ